MLGLAFPRLSGLVPLLLALTAVESESSPASEALQLSNQNFTLEQLKERFRTVADWVYGDEDAWQAALLAAWPANHTESASFLVQINVSAEEGVIAKIRDAIETREEAAGPTILSDGFAPPDVFLVWAKASTALEVLKLPEVRSVSPMLPEVKIARDTYALYDARMQWGRKARRRQMAVSCRMFRSVPDTAQDSVLDWGRKILADLVPHVSGANVTMEGDHLMALRGIVAHEDVDNATMRDILMKMAENPFVVAIEETADYRTFNDVGTSVVQSGQSNFWPFWEAGLRGQNQVVGVADSGLDVDSCFFSDPSMPAPVGALNINQAHRKVVQYVPFADDDVDGLSDHGTHVSGSVAGFSSSLESGSGTAPDAKISFFDMGRSSSSGLFVPASLAIIFNLAQRAGASIHTNSWGSETAEYTFNAQEVDDYSAANEGVVILFAAGNTGPESTTVGSPASAKNCISIGAGQSSDLEAVAPFSSRGPTLDGRIKPEVVAPGTSVQSAASLRSCRVATLSGTSMATPLTAGAVALARQYFLEGFYPSGAEDPSAGFTPSGALLKAVVVHAGQPLPGRAWPDFAQGFGRVALDSVLPLAGDAGAPNLFVHANQLQAGGETGVELASGQSYQAQFNVTFGGTFKATLVWMDPPSAMSAGWNLVNDLDLSVTRPTGELLHPNGGAGRDGTNTVEVISDQAAAGIYTVTVAGAGVPFGPQKYALVVTWPGSDQVEPLESPPAGDGENPPVASLSRTAVASGLALTLSLLSATLC